jgi:hypothetical protein
LDGVLDQRGLANAPASGHLGEKLTVPTNDFGGHP